MCYCDHDGTQVGMPCPFCGRLNMNPTPTPPKTHAEVVDLEKLAQRIEDRNYTHEDADNAAEAIRAMSKLIDECRAAGYIDDAGNVRRVLPFNANGKLIGYIFAENENFMQFTLTNLNLHAKDAHAGE